MKLLLLFLVYVTYGQDDDPYHSKKFENSDDLPEPGNGDLPPELENAVEPPPHAEFPEHPLPGGVPPELPDGEPDYRCKGSAFTECMSDVEEYCGSSEDEGPPPPPDGEGVGPPPPPEGEDEGPPPPPKGEWGPPPPPPRHMDPNRLRECLFSNYDSFSDTCKEAISSEWARVTEARNTGLEPPPPPEGKGFPGGKGYEGEGYSGEGKGLPVPPEGVPPPPFEGEGEGLPVPPPPPQGEGPPPPPEGEGEGPPPPPGDGDGVGDDNDIEDSDLFCMLNPMPCGHHHYGNRGEGVYIIGARKGKGGKGMWGGKGKGKGLGWSCVIVAFKPSSTEGGPSPPEIPDGSNPPPARPGSDDASLPPGPELAEYSYVYYGDYGDYQYQYEYDEDSGKKPIGGQAISGSSSPVGYILLGMFLVIGSVCIFWRYRKKTVEVSKETTAVPAPEGKEEQTAPKNSSFLSMLKDKITPSSTSSPYVALHV